MDAALKEQLQSGITRLDVPVGDAQCDMLMHYLELLQKWNKSYNLTAIRDPQQMLVKHLLDSLAVVPYCQGESILDVGTGAGLPGIVLAIVFPTRQFHLLDSNGKKTRFLFQVKTALGLDNMHIHCARVESFNAESGFDVIFSRAFASLADMVTGCRHLLGENGHFLAMKGLNPTTEIADVSTICRLDAVHELRIPGLAEQRHLIDLTLLK